MHLQTIVSNTIAVMMVISEKCAEWHGVLTGTLHQAQVADNSQYVEFFSALLTILDGENPTLSPENPHITALDAIQAGIADGGGGLGETTEETADKHIPEGALPADFAARCVGGIRGTPQEKEAAFDYLVDFAPSLPAAGDLIKAVQQAIFGADSAGLGSSLEGEYARIWDEICKEIGGD